MKFPHVIYVANINARAMRAKEPIAFDLANKIAHGIRGYDATTVLEELGCNLFLEMLPRHVLTDLAKESPPEVNSVPLDASELPRVLRVARQEELKE